MVERLEGNKAHLLYIDFGNVSLFVVFVLENL